MTHPTVSERRLHMEQALATTRIEGHLPTQEFLTDMDAVIAGTMTAEQARAASLARAKAKEAAGAGGNGQ